MWMQELWNLLKSTTSYVSLVLREGYMLPVDNDSLGRELTCYFVHILHLLHVLLAFILFSLIVKLHVVQTGFCY